VGGEVLASNYSFLMINTKFWVLFSFWFLGTGHLFISSCSGHSYTARFTANIFDPNFSEFHILTLKALLLTFPLGGYKGIPNVAMVKLNVWFFFPNLNLFQHLFLRKLDKFPPLKYPRHLVTILNTSPFIHMQFLSRSFPFCLPYIF
jgi:hypothetical protein